MGLVSSQILILGLEKDASSIIESHESMLQYGILWIRIEGSCISELSSMQLIRGLWLLWLGRGLLVMLGLFGGVGGEMTLLSLKF